MSEQTHARSGLYRIAIPGGRSDYWKVLEIAPNGIRWASVGRRSERMLTSYDDVIVEATDAALVGKKIGYERFGNDVEEVGARRHSNVRPDVVAVADRLLEERAELWIALKEAGD